MKSIIGSIFNFISPPLSTQLHGKKTEFLHRNALWFVRLRWIAGVVGILLVLSSYQMGFIQSSSLLVLILLGLTVLIGANTVLTLQIRDQNECSRQCLLSQVIIDLTVLTYIISLTGGLGNPLFLLFLLHVLIGGILFRETVTYKISLFTSLIVSGFILAHSFNVISVHQTDQISHLFGINNFTAVSTGTMFIALIFLTTLFSTRMMSAFRNNEQVLKNLARYDDLTGTLNRSYFSSKVEDKINEDSGASHALLYLDLDGFKQINDAYGHNAGDTVLRTMAKRFRGLTGSDDYIGRWGGDEFTVLLTDVSGQSEIEEKISEYIDQAGRPVSIGQNEVTHRLSVGISLIPEHGTTPNDLITKADIAMYEAKQKSGSGYHVFSPGSHDEKKQEIRLEDELEIALAERQIDVYYHPIVKTGHGITAGYEALARWKHPDRGTVSPGRFIPVAETSGLIHQLGEQVFEEVCRELKQSGCSANTDPFFSVNVSGIQLTHGTAVERFPEIAREHGVDPEKILLEVTETSMIEDLEDTVDQLSELRSEGFKVAVDDFGTGYSSLSYLLNLPVDVIKIDRSFVSGLPQDTFSQDLVELIDELTTTLEAEVVAEGVETLEQWDVISNYCSYGQGFLFTEPTQVPEATDEVI